MKTKPIFLKGSFRDEKTAWFSLALYTILLYSTLTLAYDLYIIAFQAFGQGAISQGIYIITLLCVVTWFCYALTRFPRKWTTYAMMGAIGLVIYGTMALEDAPANRIHFFQYFPLGILALEALRFRIHGRAIYIWAFLLVSSIGLGDECIQGLLPNRYFDAKDVMLNSLAGLLALVFVGFVVREENYPWGKRRNGTKVHP